MELTLNNLPLNTQARVISNPDTRLQELGFTVGTRVLVTAKAAFSGPIAVRVDSSTFALRLDEVDKIYVEIIQ
jgi:Fe2+ transport system protein FeoA